MKNYVHISHKIYREPWLITPSMHESIRRQFLAHIQGVTKADIVIDDEQDEPEAAQVSTVPSIAVIPVMGIIGKNLSGLEMLCGGVDVESISSQIKQAAVNPDVSSILLLMDSPGGTVTGVPELAQLIADTDKVKPVYAYCSGQTCSAAYWIASQARAFVVAPSSAIGSVGAYIYLEDHTEALAEAGIKPNAIVSESSPMKLAGADFKPLTDDERAMFQTRVNNIYKQFSEAVTAKRTVDASYLDGRTFTGEDAVKGGLADGTANDLDEMLKIISQG